MWTKPGLIAGFFLVTTGFGAAATPYFEAITAPASAGTGLSFATTGAAAANSFEVNSSGALSEVEIAIQRTSTLGGSAGSIVVTLNTDNGLTGSADGPGIILNTLGTISDTAITATGVKEIFDFKNLAVTGLSPGSTYWIEIARAGTATTRLQGYTDTSAPTIGATNPNTSSPNLYETKTTGSFATDGVTPAMQLCVSGDNSCFADNGQQTFSARSAAGVPLLAAAGVPEPVSIAVLGSGLIGLGWSRRRGRPSGRRPTKGAVFSNGFRQKRLAT